MPRAGLTRDIVISKAAMLANDIGLQNVSMKTLADYLGIKTPSLYNHIRNLDELKEELMLYGWKRVSDMVVKYEDWDDGYAGIKEYCREFYRYAKENPGVFEAMLWYNRYGNDRQQEVTKDLYDGFFKLTKKIGISDYYANHFLRTIRAFLEGYLLLLNHGAFGNPISVDESFELSLDVLLEGITKWKEN